MLKKYFKELGTGKLGKAGHAIRRGGVTELAKMGMSDLKIAQWGGWVGTSMVSRYSQLTATDIDDEVRKLNPLRRSI